jgi:hypothetical protein
MRYSGQMNDGIKALYERGDGGDIKNVNPMKPNVIPMEGFEVENFNSMGESKFIDDVPANHPASTRHKDFHLELRCFAAIRD